MDQKRLGPLEKPLRMKDMCTVRYIINMHVSNTKFLKYKKRRIRKRRIVPTRRIRRGKKRRIRKDE
jgi:hypothetical protein